jgi:sugar phosphate isomerase/epimerase
MGSFTLTGFADEAAVDLDGQIAALKANDMHYIELRGIDGISVGDINTQKAKQTARKLEDEGIMVSCIGSPLGKTRLDEPFAPVLEILRRLCAHAALLKTDKIRIFSFYLPDNRSPESCRSEVIDRMGRMLDIAEAEGITLLHENERDIYGDTQDRCLDLHRALDSRLRGILDPANYLLVGTDPLSAMKALEPWIDYLHIKDVRLHDRRIVPAGAGDGKIPEILKIMAQKPGRRFLSIEPHLTLFAGREKLEHDTGAAMPGSGNDFVYKDGPAAFAAAVAACRDLVMAMDKGTD